MDNQTIDEAFSEFDYENEKEIEKKNKIHSIYIERIEKILNVLKSKKKNIKYVRQN